MLQQRCDGGLRGHAEREAPGQRELTRERLGGSGPGCGNHISPCVPSRPRLARRGPTWTAR